VSFSLPQEKLQEIARVGRKDVGVSDESESVSASWNAGFIPRDATHGTMCRSCASAALPLFVKIAITYVKHRIL